MLSGDPLAGAGELASDEGESKSKGGSTTGLKIGLVIAILIALAGVALAVVVLIQLRQTDGKVKTNETNITNLLSDMTSVKPVAALYDSGSKTLTLENLEVDYIKFAGDGVNRVGAMGLTGRNGQLQVLANVKDKGLRVVSFFKYQPDPGGDPGSLYVAGGVGQGTDRTLKEHTCKPQDFC